MIRDLTKIQCGIGENAKCLNGKRDSLKFVYGMQAFFVRLSEIREVVRFSVKLASFPWCLLSKQTNRKT